MKLWLKVTLCIQTIALVFFILMARIQAAEAEKQHTYAQLQAEQAKLAREEAVNMAELAEKNAARLQAAQSEAQLQLELATNAQAELAKCRSNK